MDNARYWNSSVVPDMEAIICYYIKDGKEYSTTIHTIEASIDNDWKDDNGLDFVEKRYYGIDGDQRPTVISLYESDSIGIQLPEDLIYHPMQPHLEILNITRHFIIHGEEDGA